MKMFVFLIGFVLLSMVVFQQRKIRSLEASQAQKPQAAIKRPDLEDFQLQKACQEQAEKEFNRLGFAKEQFSEFQNNYSYQFHGCFVKISDTTITAGSPGQHMTVENANTGKVIGVYDWFNATKKKYWEVAPMTCFVGDQQCKTSEEFDALAKVYLEN